jgi:hypothetical protein
MENRKKAPEGMDTAKEAIATIGLSSHEPGEKVDFGLALAEDLPRIRALVAGVSGGFPHSVPEDVLKAWIRKNPQSVHILRRGPEIVGYISMFPLPHETLMQRLSGKLLNRTIPVDDIFRESRYFVIRLD